MKIASMILLILSVAIMGYDAYLMRKEVKFLYNATNVYHAELTRLKARSCRIANCADPRMGWTAQQIAKAEELCGEPEACPRRQLFIAGDEVEAITALTETWEMGQRVCR